MLFECASFWNHQAAENSSDLHHRNLRKWDWPDSPAITKIYSIAYLVDIFRLSHTEFQQRPTIAFHPCCLLFGQQSLHFVDRNLSLPRSRFVSFTAHPTSCQSSCAQNRLLWSSILDTIMIAPLSGFQQFSFQRNFLTQIYPHWSNQCFLKPFVIDRKNFLFANTPSGAKSSAVIFSLIQTATENGLDPYHYLTRLLSSAAEMDLDQSQNARLLLPWNAPAVCKV